MAITGKEPEQFYKPMSETLYNDGYLIADWIFAVNKSDEMLSLYWDDKADYTTYGTLIGSFTVFQEATRCLDDVDIDDIKNRFIKRVEDKHAVSNKVRHSIGRLNRLSDMSKV